MSRSLCQHLVRLFVVDRHIPCRRAAIRALCNKINEYVLLIHQVDEWGPSVGQDNLPKIKCRRQGIQAEYTKNTRTAK